jgi:hypothetical protein
LSHDAHDFIEKSLRQGISPDTILQQVKHMCLNDVQRPHNLLSHADVLDAFQSGSIPIPRDYLITTQDIVNRRLTIEKESWRYTNSDAENVRLLWMKHQSSFLLYQQQESCDGVEKVPFIAVLQTPWQRKKLIELGHNNAFLMDATFNTNKQKVLTF